MSFYFAVSTVAVIILIIALVGIGIAFNTPNNKEVFPTIQNKCPDYWIIDDAGKCTIPTAGQINVPTKTIDATSQPSTPGLIASDNKINFEDSGWSSMGTSSTCYKKKWANSYSIIWDGVTNYNNC